MIGWSPELRVDTLSLVHPLPWARAIGELRFTPERWGPGVFRLAAPGGAHLLVRRHGAPELALWLPAELEPQAGERFGIYLHNDQDLAVRARAASDLRRALGTGLPARASWLRDADRLAAMLRVYDLARTGASLRDIADRIMSPLPQDWRSSSARSDLRRLAEAGTMMAERGYRDLLHQRRRLCDASMPAEAGSQPGRP